MANKPETSPLAKTEDAAARVVRAAVGKALREMERVVASYFFDGREDRLRVAQIVQMTAQLEQIAKQYGVEVAKPTGELARLMAEARTSGVKESLAPEAATTWLNDNKDALDIALHNDGVKIKGVLAESTARINEIIVSARLSGKPKAEVVEEIMARMTDVGEMTRNRAETIFRSETFSGHRQFAHASALDEGVEYWQMVGVADSRTTDLCLSYLGKIKTTAEWEKIEPLVFRYGLHRRCRHNWVPVRNPDAKRHTEREEMYREMARKQEAKREAA